MNAVQSPQPENAMERTGRLPPLSPEDDALIVKLKEEDGLSWDEITGHFPGRKKGTLQVRYCIKLKQRPERRQPGRKRQRSG